MQGEGWDEGLKAKGQSSCRTSHRTASAPPQVGSAGEEAAAQYLLTEAQAIAAEAAANRPDLVVEAVRESVGTVSLRLGL